MASIRCPKISEMEQTTRQPVYFIFVLMLMSLLHVYACNVIVQCILRDIGVFHVANITHMIRCYKQSKLLIM